MKKFTVITLFSTLLLVSGTELTTFADEAVPTTENEISVDKTEPTDPVDPTVPINPTEPAEPTNSTEPTMPVDPVDPPVTPTDPAEPVQPTEPSEPEKTVEPTEPTTPTEPSEPNTPTEPSKPVEPEKSAQPTEPAKPVEPVNPSETPVNTDTGQVIVGVEESNPIIQLPDGTTKKVPASEIGATVQQDGTLAITTSDGKMKVLPKTGEESTAALSMLGGFMLLGSGILLKKRRKSVD